MLSLELKLSNYILARIFSSAQYFRKIVTDSEKTALNDFYLSHSLSTVQNSNFEISQSEIRSFFSSRIHTFLIVNSYINSHLSAVVLSILIIEV